MSNPKILVTGTSGLIGGVVASYLGNSFEVVQMGRRESSDLKGDFNHIKSFSNIDFSSFDAVIHCAGIVDEDFKDDPAQAYIRATINSEAFFECLGKSGVKKVINFSTAHVYGKLSGTIHESTGVAPLNHYGVGHFATECVLRNVARKYRFDSCSVRPLAVFGFPEVFETFDRGWLIPYSFPTALVESGKIILKSRGYQKRSFVGAMDLARIVEVLLSNDTLIPPVVNAVGKETLSVYEFAELCASIYKEKTGKQAMIQRPEGDYTEEESFNYECRALDYSAQEELETFVEDLILHKIK
tara:strand:+ start:4142 stop:5038 length:897 start_codon:yes stop_codon:yes gene_type:complete